MISNIMDFMITSYEDKINSPILTKSGQTRLVFIRTDHKSQTKSHKGSLQFCIDDS